VGVTATPDDVALLLGRAAFGATKNDLAIWAGQDYDDLVDALIKPTPAPVPQADDARRTQLESGTTDYMAMQRWWLARMATTTLPLVERMTWFWHTHIPTAFLNPPDVGTVLRQNQTLRTHALGDFRALMRAITVDPAMLHYLSGNRNKRGAVNENYARELFELFTMGTRPQTYTEYDIREAAKALTGWSVKSDRTATFNGANHDRTKKYPFGVQVGGYPAGDARENVEYQEIVELALKQPTTAKYVAYKMVGSFGYQPQTDNLLTDPDPLVDAVAATLRPALPDGVWDIATAVRMLLTHSAFRYADHAAGKALVRSPVETVVHLGKILGVNLDPPGGIQNTTAGEYNYPISALRRMGQVPFQPPNVGGWPKGTEWLSTISTRARYDAGQYLLNAYTKQSKQNTHPLPASGDLTAWTAHMGLGHLSTVTRNQLNAYLASPGTSTEVTKQQSVLLLLAASPDWQVM
jgi:uncharacterized protein (DUF1800 family)